MEGNGNLRLFVLIVIQFQSLPCVIYAPVAAQKIHFRVTILTVMSGNDHTIAFKSAFKYEIVQEN